VDGVGRNQSGIGGESAAAANSRHGLYHIPDNKTPHTNLNQSEDTQVRFLYFARYREHEPRP